MDIQLLTKVKYNGKWYDPGIVIEKFDDKEGERLVSIGAAKLVEQPVKVNLDDEKLEQLRERAKELGIPRATQMGEAKLLEAIAAKEAETAGEAADTGAIEGVVSAEAVTKDEEATEEKSVGE